MSTGKSPSDFPGKAKAFIEPPFHPRGEISIVAFVMLGSVTSYISASEAT